MSITKKPLKSKPFCKVTFKLSKKDVKSANTVHVVGDFNKWELTSPMKKNSKGGFTLTLDLASGKDQQFRYLIDGTKWVNESEADKQVATEFEDAQNSVLEL